MWSPAMPLPHPFLCAPLGQLSRGSEQPILRLREALRNFFPGPPLSEESQAHEAGAWARLCLFTFLNPLSSSAKWEQGFPPTQCGSED